jgi:DNA helicase-2/ATP-dependent DNA helicase PcrA
MSRKPTPEQQRVIDTHQGVTIVSACPGSGKTTTLALRAAALPPGESKLVMAFNKRAATEFAERMGMVPRADVRTFHSFCMREIYRNPKAYGYKGKPKLLEESLPYQIGAALGVDPRARTWEAMQLDEQLFLDCDAQGMYDQGVRDAMELAETEQERITYRAVLAYRKWLYDTNSMTFSSMIRTVAEHKEKLAHFGQHVMIDEYQDVDGFQFDIICAMGACASTKSMVVVGDPNQRIYEWRGALEDAFLSMRERFVEARELALSTNFRSYSEIVEAGEAVCPVGVTAARGRSPGNDAVVQLDAEKVSDALSVRELMGGDLTKSAVLCRYNRNCFMWQSLLSKAGIPVYVMGGGQFWTVRHVKIIMRFREARRGLQELLDSREWQLCMQMKSYQGKKEEEATQDAMWLMGLKDDELRDLRNCIQNEAKGLKIATIHKTKGLEFDRVLLSGIDEKLVREKFVYYVALTRAKDKLYLC